MAANWELIRTRFVLARNVKGFSQERAGAAFGVSRRTWMKLEKSDFGALAGRKLESMCAAIGLAYWTLFMDDCW